MIRLLASDIDGTLLPIGGRMSERTKHALKRLCDSGVVLVPATGRCYFNATGPFREIGIDCPVISCNGGRVDMHCTCESPVFEDTIDRESSEKVLRLLLDAGCFMTSYVGTKVYALPEINGYGSKCMGISEAGSPDKDEYEALKRTMVEEGSVNPYKYEAYSDDSRLLCELKRELTAMGLSVSGAFEFNLEIMAHGAGKGRALKTLAEKLGISKSEIMALGDGSNDISLLEAAGLPVAMENASESLKPKAKRIAPDASLDGAAQMIETYVLAEISK